ncbi:MAG: hypothetical protein D6761_07565 [Candidatus Dadabacteria bacterium]|nr:MAG: hypothetical protein D6761_07565 [Candidatus Dadabacteria bacterium]
MALLLAGPAAAWAETDEELLEAFSAAVSSAPEQPSDSSSGFRSTALNLMNPAISFIADAAVSVGDGNPVVDQFSTDHDPVKNGFTLQQIELSVQSPVDPYLEYFMAMVFTLEGFEIEEAYGTTRALPAGLQSRFGKVKWAAGRENATHLHSWSFGKASLLRSGLLGAESLSSLGVELSWLTPLPFYDTLQAVAADQAAADELADELGLAPTTAPTGPGGWFRRQFYLLRNEASFTPMDALAGNVGVWAAQSGPSFARLQWLGADLYAKWRSRKNNEEGRYLALTVEAAGRRAQTPANGKLDIAGYELVDIHFAQRWLGSLRHEWLHQRSQGEALTQRSGLAIAFRPSEFSKFRIEGFESHSPAGHEGWTVDLGFELVAGAHGAHSF